MESVFACQRLAALFERGNYSHTLSVRRDNNVIALLSILLAHFQDLVVS